MEAGITDGSASKLPQEATVNKLQRHLRVISDTRLDDTSVELDACERARIALDITKRALMDRCITAGEALEILEAQKAVIQASDLSLAYNVRQQPQLDEFIAYLKHVPADALARMPAPPAFRLDDVFSADARACRPSLGRVTVGELLHQGDDLEAA